MLVDFPATAHYSRESSNLQPPLRYALGTPLTLGCSRSSEP